MTGLIPILLAAGASRRYGSCKSLLEDKGKSLLQQRIEALQQAGLRSPIVITGAWHEQIHHQHPELDLRYNLDWQSGIGATIAFAITQLPTTADAALLLLTDQVAIDSTDISALSNAWLSNSRLICAHYAGHPGVPAIFPRALFSQLKSLSGDSGAKALLHGYAAEATALPMPHGAIDIDTPNDWQRWQNSNSQHSNGELSWN